MKNLYYLLIITLVPLCITAGCCCTGNCCTKKETVQVKKNTQKKNPVQKLVDNKKTYNENDDQKKIIQDAYAEVAKEGTGCCGGCCGGGCCLSSTIGYTKEELEMFADANLGLGCGHPVSLGYIKEGHTVLDLGSGAGLDCFLAARKVGPNGKVIGVDMTPAMIEKARENAQKYGFTQVEFRLGDIEALPVDSNSIDVIMSNCVINLAPHKHMVFQEAGRVLKKGGAMAISDVVLLKDLSPKQKHDKALLSACVSGAILKNTYIGMLETAGFEVTIIDEDREINQKWFGSNELPIASLKFIARKK